MLWFATIQPDFLHNIKHQQRQNLCVLNSQQKKQPILPQGLQEGSKSLSGSGPSYMGETGGLQLPNAVGTRANIWLLMIPMNLFISS